jgi:hypothetical protein
MNYTVSPGYDPAGPTAKFLQGTLDITADFFDVASKPRRQRLGKRGTPVEGPFSSGGVRAEHSESSRAAERRRGLGESQLLCELRRDCSGSWRSGADKKVSASTISSRTRTPTASMGTRTRHVRAGRTGYRSSGLSPSLIRRRRILLSVSMRVHARLNSHE